MKRFCVIHKLIIFCALSLVMAACSGSRNNLFVLPEQAHSAVNYTLDSGDVLKIVVYGEDELSGKYSVDGEGQINFPLVGFLNVKDKHVKDVEANIVKALRNGYLKHPRVSLDISDYRPFYIVGEIREPGSYSYVSGMTVFNAVALGGGFSYRADRDSIIIKRRVTDVEGVDPEIINYAAELDSFVLPGDIIEIEERLF